MRAREQDKELNRAYVRAYRAKVKARGGYGLCKVCGKPLGRNDDNTRHFKKLMVCRNCLWGKNHHHWRGKGFKNPDGYIVIRIGKLQTKLEHRYIMEQHLGRELYEDETVHHKNGIRDDNRLENLELWVGAPTRGIRTPDAVKWAKEILYRYEGLEL